MQIVLVIVTVSAAIFYLIRRFYLTAQRKKQSGCEKCGLNPNAKSTVR